MTKIRNEILSRKEAARNFLSSKRKLWSDCERLFHNQLADSISQNETTSQVTDPKLATLTLERSFRVMSQLPVGKVRGISKNDIGSSLVMNLILDKYVNPNANSQFDLLTKFRMVDLYSNIYGNFFALVDWNIKENGYVGPDIWLLNIRDVFPQVGAVSIEDSDYIIVRTWKPLSFFEDLAKRKEKGYKNLSKIITKLEKKSGSKQSRSSGNKSERESDQYPSSEVAKQKGYFEVLSQYEGDRWVDFCVDANTEFRDIKNPHDNGELPVVCKYSIPLLDDFFGMGDFERGMPIQKTIDSIWNLYLGAIRMSIYPPVLLNKDLVASPSSISYIPGAKWLVRGNIGNVASPIQLNPQGISTFNNTYQVANAALLNLFGTTDTSVTSQIEAGYGKTPKALQLQKSRENTRDNADRFYMERFLNKVYKKFVNLIGKMQSSAIAVRMFKPELEEMARSYPDIEKMYDEKTGKLIIDKKTTGSTLWDYEVISGSTYAVDQKTQLDNIQQYIALFLKSQSPQGNLLQAALENEGYEFRFAELFKKGIVSSGIRDWDKILVEKTPEENADNILEKNKQQFEMAVRQAMSGNNINQVPAQPSQPQQPVGGMGQMPIQ